MNLKFEQALKAEGIWFIAQQVYGKEKHTVFQGMHPLPYLIEEA